MRGQQHMFIALHAQQHTIPRVEARVVAVRAEVGAMQFTDRGYVGEVKINEASS